MTEPKSFFLTGAEIDRLRNMFACGPLIRRPVDDGLMTKGWAALDGSMQSVDVDVSTDFFFEKNGSVKEFILGRSIS